MYLEKLYINKAKLKTFESRLSKEVFNGDKVKFKYDEKKDNFYFMINDKHKLEVGDFFEIDLLKDNLNVLNAKKLTITCNIVMSELFDKKDCNDENIYLRSAIDHFNKLRENEENKIFQYGINSKTSQIERRYYFKPRNYYMSVERGLRDQLHKIWNVENNYDNYNCGEI